MDFTEQKDSMGSVRVPAGAYYGAQTQRAVENLAVSGLKLPAEFIRALGLIKLCAAKTNAALSLLDPQRATAVQQAAEEVLAGRFDDQFVVDVFQTGSGTSTNMNMNEVIASRANEILTGSKTAKSPVHPNDHVNLGQSSNDVIPSALHIAARGAIRKRLIPALEALHDALERKSVEFADVRKIGRTHLQDAVPIYLGQEFGGYARQIELAIARIAAMEPRLSELALGGTAVGNGINTHARFAARVIAEIVRRTHLSFKEAVNHFEAQAARDAVVETSGALKTLAVSLVKIGNDIRWLASGPRCGLGELNIPALQPGSSIMPGKVNPVIPEAVIQVAAQVMGNDTTIMMGGQAGNFELNVMMPVMAYNLLQSIDLSAAVVAILTEKCIIGITANREKCAAYIEESLALVTALVPHIGYDKAAAIAQEAYASGRTVREVALARQILSEDLINELL